MLFNSSDFLIFFPIVVTLYFLIPHKYRYIWIFLTSYYFYMCWNPIYSLLLLGITGITYLCALGLEKTKGKSRNLSFILTLSVSIIVLGIFKYAYFITKTINSALGIIHININIPTPSLVVPVGISFYLFQSLAYVIDVYRNKIKAERNFILYAAYISFFPQLVAGPIERADKLLPQFYEKHTFDYDRVKNNILLMLWGFFIKIVIADRVAIFVDTVYDNHEMYGGWLLIMATVFFAFQIYCDFAGYSLIAKGAAGVMGFELMDNFASPYCASSVKEFWARWHISLTSWFRDYVYIPLGGNRRGKLRKYLNTIIVFLLSGLWHGPSWSFVLWGTLNGAYIVFEEIIHNLFAKIKFHLPKLVKRIFGIIVTFVCVDFAWIFFRAQSMGKAVSIIKSMLTFSNFNALFDNTIHFYIMKKQTLYFVFASILVLIVVDCFHYAGIHFRERIAKRNIVVRWSFYLVLIMSILIFGVWGPNFDKAAFIYFQF